MFIKYDISNNIGEEFVGNMQEKSFNTFQQCTESGELIYALDWQHESYLDEVRLEFQFTVS
ncbi:hypothetical protein BCE02nite_35220 [Brevibacillus centrosporus]|nr:hypothetical protein BCE02nite_35220 [Brevibacillus centrosporus]